MNFVLVLISGLLCIIELHDYCGYYIKNVRIFGLGQT